jgi:hypothetical protein
MSDFKTRLNDVSFAAWLIWTGNGFGLDEFELEQTTKTATDAANNAYVEGVSKTDWVDGTLSILQGGAEPRLSGQRSKRCAAL